MALVSPSWSGFSATNRTLSGMLPNPPPRSGVTLDLTVGGPRGEVAGVLFGVELEQQDQGGLAVSAVPVHGGTALVVQLAELVAQLVPVVERVDHLSHGERAVLAREVAPPAGSGRSVNEQLAQVACEGHGLFHGRGGGAGCCRRSGDTGGRPGRGARRVSRQGPAQTAYGHESEHTTTGDQENQTERGEGDGQWAPASGARRAERHSRRREFAGSRWVRGGGYAAGPTASAGCWLGTDAAPR